MRGIVLTCGYVESQSFSEVILYHSQIEGRWSEILHHLTRCLLEVYLKETSSPVKKKCCQKAHGNFCSTCGASLESPSFNWEDFGNWIEELSCKNCDNSGSLFETLYANQWNLNAARCLLDLDKEDILLLDSYPSRTLIATLKPEDVPETNPAGLLEYQENFPVLNMKEDETLDDFLLDCSASETGR